MIRSPRNRSALRRAVVATCESLEARRLLAGTGLKGEYFDEHTFTQFKFDRTDATVNFNWGFGSPDPSIHQDWFSVRWSGQVEAPAAGSYTFYTQTDDGVKLWVNNQLLIDQWQNQALTEHSGAISLVAGQRYDIKMEYFDAGNEAVAKLLWAGPSIAKQIIPTSQLYVPGSPVTVPADAPVLTAVTPATATKTITLSFTDTNTNETEFKVYRREAGGAWGLLAKRGTSGASSYIDDDPALTSFTSYEYKLVASNTAGDSPESNVESLMTPGAPAAPTAPGASASQGQVDVTWTHVGTGQSGFTIQRSRDAAFDTIEATFEIDTAGTRSYADTAVAGDVTYHYRVRAKNAWGASAFATAAAVTTPQPPARELDGGVIVSTTATTTTLTDHGTADWVK